MTSMFRKNIKFETFIVVERFRKELKPVRFVFAKKIDHVGFYKFLYFINDTMLTLQKCKY